MSSKFISIMLLLFTVTLSSLNAQEKKIIVERQIHRGDSASGEHMIVFDRDLPDSTIEDIIIHKIPRHHQKTARIVIKKSGLFRKSKIVIDFNPMTKKIVNVMDNGKEVPGNKFHKYQDYLEDATELAPLEALHPAMEEMDLKIELGELPSLEGLEGLDSLIIHLEALESAHATIKKEHYKLVKHVVELDNLAETIQNILAENGATPPQKIKNISIKKGVFHVNGKEIKGEVGDKCIQAYVDLSDLTNEDLNSKEDEINIKIQFD